LKVLSRSVRAGSRPTRAVSARSGAARDAESSEHRGDLFHRGQRSRPVHDDRRRGRL